MLNIRKICVLLALALLCAPMFSVLVNASNTINVTPSKDTWMQGGPQSDYNDANWGLSQRFDVGADNYFPLYPVYSRGLVEFDLPPEISGKVIISAVLRLRQFGQWTDAEPWGLLLRACRVNSTHDWVEGNGGTIPTGIGTSGATWNEYDKSTSTNNWTTPGGDYTLVGSSTTVWPDIATANWVNFTVTSIVQGWAIGSFPNHGFLIKLDDESSPTPAKGGTFAVKEPTSILPGSILEICYGSDFVVPEVPLGTVIASTAMIMGLIAYFGIPRLPRLNRKR